MNKLYYKSGGYLPQMKSGGRTCMMCGGVHYPSIHNQTMTMNTASMKPMQMAYGGRNMYQNSNDPSRYGNYNEMENYTEKTMYQNSGYANMPNYFGRDAAIRTANEMDKRRDEWLLDQQKAASMGAYGDSWKMYNRSKKAAEARIANPNAAYERYGFQGRDNAKDDYFWDKLIDQQNIQRIYEPGMQLNEEGYQKHVDRDVINRFKEKPQPKSETYKYKKTISPIYANGGRIMYQDSGRIPSDYEMGRDMVMFAEDELGVPRGIASRGKMNNLSQGYIPPNAKDYLGYKVAGEKTIKDINPDADIPVEMRYKTSHLTDSRSAPGVNQETLKKIAGTSQWTGTSNYLPAKIAEMLPGTLKAFRASDVSSDPDNVFTDDFTKQLMSMGLTEDEIRSVKLNEVHKGKVGKVIGEMMRDSYGVRSKNAGVQSPNANVTNRANTQSYGGNRTAIGQSENLGQFAISAIDATIANNGILPRGYREMPEEFKQEVERLARMSKMERDPVSGEMRQTSTGRDLISQGRFDQRTREAYRKANENAGTEMTRQDSATFEKVVDEGNKVDKFTDLAITPINGKNLSFNEAFAYARNNNIPVFTWRGELKLAKRPDELTQDEKDGLARAAYKGKSLSGSQSTKPSVSGTQTNMSRTKNVSNTQRNIVPIKKYGGRTNRWSY